jgi:polyether ionophore transport system permease protein
MSVADRALHARHASTACRRAPTRALARRAFLDARVRTLAFAYVFAAYSYIQPAGFRSAYPTLADRLSFARSFGTNKGIRLFYGEPHSIATVNGYTAWRVGGTLAIAAAVFGLLAAVRASRAEEDAGRRELVLAAPVGRHAVNLAGVSAILVSAAVLWVAEFAGFVVGGLPVGGAAYLALTTASVVVVCAGVAAVAGELAPNRRIALQLGAAVIGVTFMLRVLADTVGGLGWLRWLTPLGWAEQMRPLTGSQPLVLLLPLLTSAALFILAARIATRRDIGTGVLPARDSAEPRLGMLSSPLAQALRSSLGSLSVWVGAVAFVGLILGSISKSVSPADVSKSMQTEIAKLGSGSITTPSGYIAFVFIFVVLTVSLFMCAQIGAARQVESDQQLETLLAMPVSRRRWLAGRLLIALGAGTAISLTAGLAAWAGAQTAGAHVSLPKMLEAGANCLPTAIVFLGIAVLAYALAPRASSGIAYGIVSIAFLWQLTGSLLGVPRWLLDATPFAHVGVIPVQPFRTVAAIVMVAIGVLCAAAAVAWFERRDLIGA